MAKRLSRKHPSHNPRFEFRWENFRSFKDTGWIGVRPITVFIGANSSGKTSLTRPLLLMKQTMDSRDSRIALKTTGPLADVGTFRDLVFGHNSGLGVRFRLRFTFPEDSPPSKELKPIGMYPPGEVLIELRAGSEPTEINLYRLSIFDVYKRAFLTRTRLSDRRYSLVFGKRMDAKTLKLVRDSRPTHFLFPSVRVMQQIMQREQEKKLRDRSKRGRKGRTTTELKISLSEGSAVYIGLMRFAEEELTKLFSRLSYIGPLREYPRRFYEGAEEIPETVGLRGEDAPRIMFLKKDPIFRKEVDTWLRNFGLADKITCEGFHEDLFAISTREPRIKYEIGYADAGFGLSQLLPLVVQGFHAPQGSVMFLEQPEIHLNPRLQGQLGNLLAAVAKKRHTVIVETHSEHLVSRLRTLIANGTLKPDDVALYYVEKDKGESSVRLIPILEDGHIEPMQWPKGFFEDSLSEALQLARWPEAEGRS